MWGKVIMIQTSEVQEKRLLDVIVIDKNQFGFIYAELMNRERKK